MLRVRPYRQGDAKTIVTWCKDKETFYKWSAGILGDYPISAQKMEDATMGRLDNARYFPFVAVEEGDVVGFFTLRHPDESDEELRFGFVIVSPDVRGKGYGKKMLQLGLKFVFEVYGAKKASLGVFENNSAAYQCYKTVGFRENEQIDWYNLNGEKWKCIEMELSVMQVFSKE